MQDINIGWNKRIDTLFKNKYERAENFKNEFEICSLEPIKRTNHDKNTPILICVIKDDLFRIEKFIEHYRKQGIFHFVFVDNDSTDGTYEFILQQKDCDLFVSKDTYSSLRRVVWINKIISVYGTERWYLMVDSDEFIYYQNMENISLVDMIHFAEQKGITRISGYLLDMYPKGNLFEQKEDFLKQNRFFDVKGYDIHNYEYGVNIFGGPRRRVFRIENEMAKCPIFKLEDDDIVASSHFLLPRIKAKRNPLWLAIGHYKFLNQKDIEKIDNAVKNENYSCGSREYKAYQKGIQKENINTFYNPKFSIEFTDSSVIEKLPFINFCMGEFHDERE